MYVHIFTSFVHWGSQGQQNTTCVHPTGFFKTHCPFHACLPVPVSFIYARLILFNLTRKQNYSLKPKFFLSPVSHLSPEYRF